jgi:hypothetical protein
LIVKTVRAASHPGVIPQPASKTHAFVSAIEWKGRRVLQPLHIPELGMAGGRFNLDATAFHIFSSCIGGRPIVLPERIVVRLLHEMRRVALAASCSIIADHTCGPRALVIGCRCADKRRVAGLWLLRSIGLGVRKCSRASRVPESCGSFILGKMESANTFVSSLTPKKSQAIANDPGQPGALLIRRTGFEEVC